MAVRQNLMSSANDHVAEMLLILINLLATWLNAAKSKIWAYKEKYHDFMWAQSVAETQILFQSVWGCMT